MSSFVQIIEADQVEQARQDAIDEFIKTCIITFGYVPFTDEYFERSWPGIDRDALLKVRGYA